MTGITFILISLAFFALCFDNAAAQSPTITVQSNGQYSVAVDGVTWFTNGSTEFNSDNKTYSTSDGSLKLLGSSKDTGSDVFGKWLSYNFMYQADALSVTTTIKTYPSGIVPVIVFTQYYQVPANFTSANDRDKLVSKFPSISLESVTSNLGFMTYSDVLNSWQNVYYGIFDTSTDFKWGVLGGPFVLFDEQGKAMVISPLSQFMAASNYLDKDTKQVSWGIMGNVEVVPQEFSIDFIIFFSDLGINDAMSGWGNYLTTLYGKSSDFKDNDPTVQYMGYWTDNGAFYYYNTEPEKNYEETIIDVDAYVKNLGVPFKYYQFDSWWYSKGHIGGTKTWEPMPTIFPDGFSYLSQKTQVPFGAHNRFWDADTTYATANGGQFLFVIDKDTGYSVPDDDQFWMYLFNTTQGWGKFSLYEQDWLAAEIIKNSALMSDITLGRRWLMDMGSAASTFNITIQYCGASPSQLLQSVEIPAVTQDWLSTEIIENSVLQTDIDLGRRWLMGMGSAASAFGITIQYCTASSSQILQSLEIPAVTQARVSHDYEPGNENWKIGVTSILADAVNIAPFKDTFWTTVDQPGNTYNASEPLIELVGAISTLSTGPVGPGDELGYINKTLLMKCCDTTGKILKPGKPLKAIDAQMMKKAFGSDYQGPIGEVYSSYTNISGYLFGIIFAANLSNNYNITPESAWPSVNLQFSDSLVYSTMNPTELSPVTFDAEDPVTLGPKCTPLHFCLYYTSPIITVSSGEIMVIMGELDKWSPISPQRILKIDFSMGDVFIYINVNSIESVQFTLYRQNENRMTTVICDNSKDSSPKPNTVITFSKDSCALG